MNKHKTMKLADLEIELGVSRWTLYLWIKTGKLLAFKLPCGHYRIPTREVQRIKAELVSNKRLMH